MLINAQTEVLLLRGAAPVKSLKTLLHSIACESVSKVHI